MCYSCMAADARLGIDSKGPAVMVAQRVGEMAGDKLTKQIIDSIVTKNPLAAKLLSPHADAALDKLKQSKKRPHGEAFDLMDESQARVDGFVASICVTSEEHAKAISAVADLKAAEEAAKKSKKAEEGKKRSERTAAEAAAKVERAKDKERREQQRAEDDMAAAERKAAREAARLAKAANPKPMGQPKAAEARAPAPAPPAVRKAAVKVPRQVEEEGDPYARTTFKKRRVA